MKCFLFILCLCLPAVECCAEDTKDKPAPPKSNDEGSSEFTFDGVWKPKGAMLGGVLLPPAAREAISLTIDGDKYEVTVKGEEHSDKGTFVLDESVTPKRMTIKSTSGPNQGKTILAIYEIKGPNAMRVCYDLSGKAFPAEFKAPKNTELYLVGYRRQKPTVPDGTPKPAQPEPDPQSGQT